MARTPRSTPRRSPQSQSPSRRNSPRRTGRPASRRNRGSTSARRGRHYSSSPTTPQRSPSMTPGNSPKHSPPRSPTASPRHTSPPRRSSGTLSLLEHSAVVNVGSGLPLATVVDIEKYPLVNVAAAQAIATGSDEAKERVEDVRHASPDLRDASSVHLRAGPSHAEGNHEKRQDLDAPKESMFNHVLSRTSKIISNTTNELIDFLLPPDTKGEGTSTSTPEPRDGSRKETHVAFAEVVEEHVEQGEHNPEHHSEHRARTPIISRSSHLEQKMWGKLEHLKWKAARLSARFFQAPYKPQAKEHTFWQYVFIAYQTLGVVYGDLGTSPLYVYPTILVKDPTEEDFLGILSLIFWTLTLIGVLKYGLIVLHADDHGEGGTFAMYSLLCQHASIGEHQGEESPIPLEQMGGRRLSYSCSMDERAEYSRAKEFLENSDCAQKLLLFIVMTGTCMLIGDGILTPAISVISAIEGIRTANPAINTTIVVIISAGILITLFFLQRFGTGGVAAFFSPVMAIWLITTPLVGIYNIALYYPGIFKAFSPACIFTMFKKDSQQAWLMLGGTVLCITGAEAMYADLGHFNRYSIQLAFCAFVYPSVLLTYSGQTAYLIKHPEDHREGFFKMVPHSVYWPMFLVSTLAAIVASQGLISATFSIIKQSVALNYFPRVKLVHTSDNKEGQIYSPEVTYILMVLCLAVVFGFQDSESIGNAFGVAVVFVMIITTCLMTIVMLVIWKCPTPAALSFFFVFFILEFLYLTAVVNKVPQGGWLPFVVAVVVTVIMFSWNRGCQAKFHYEMRHEVTKAGFHALLRQVGNVRVPGICFLYTDLMRGIPPIVQHYVRNVRSLHRVLVFTTVRFLPVKTVLPNERFLVGRTGFDGVYRCVARYGYLDVLDLKNNGFLDQFLENLIEYITLSAEKPANAKLPITEDGDEFLPRPVNAEIAILRKAGRDGAVYVLGRGELRVGKNSTLWTRIFVGKVFRFLQANCRSEVSTMDIPYAQYLEIGMFYDI